MLAQLGQQKEPREHLHVNLLSYALTHCNPSVEKFANIALMCARSRKGGYIAVCVIVMTCRFIGSNLYVRCTSYIVIANNVPQLVY